MNRELLMLVDAIAREKLDQWHAEREAWLCDHPQPWNFETDEMYHRLFSERVETWLDQGSGSCVLAREDAASVVENAMRYFDGERYILDAYVIMPNHVHVLVTLMPGEDLSSILHSWKSFTAKTLAKVEAASRRLQPWWDKQSKGDRTIWQNESFDHLVRSPESLYRFESYIRDHREWREWK
jgi:REP element-mobilizing transposase RayT